MSQAFPHLFQPLQLRHKTLKNRIVFGAHTANMSEGGLPGDRHLGYYRERARGGAAMIVVEPVPVNAHAVLTRGNFRHGDDAVISGFRRITDACREHGTVMIQQLYHVGAHGDWDNSFAANHSPSGAPSMHDSDGSHRMSLTEIEATIEAFAVAAGRARAAGYDGVELMAAYNAIIEQFWSPLANRRDDIYGGSFVKRMRFSHDLLSAIRRKVGEDFIIGMAISLDPGSPAALTIEQQVEIALWHEKLGLYDYTTLGTGSYFDFTKIIPPFVYEDKMGAPFAEAMKAAMTTMKVQAESHIRTPENADYVIASGQADMVSIVRGQIADPHLANKAKAGRPEDVRGCISCNQMCWGRRSRDYWISCLINPSAGREFEWDGDTFKPAARPGSVLVVGGGPAGLEAARVAAERGHRVILAEATDRLGGQFRLAGLQPRRGQITDLIAWYEGQLARLQVEIRLNTYLEADEIAAMKADAVVLATGSQPAMTGWQRALAYRDTMPGVDGPNVWSVEDVMRREARLGARILILDDAGNWRAPGTAWHLAEKGHQVTLLTADAYIGRDLARTAADFPMRARLKKLGVTFVTDSVIVAWHGDAATIRDLSTGEERRQDFDSLVLATTNVSDTALQDELARTGIDHHAIGDCLAPRHAAAAIYEGRKLGLSL
jgi:2,4-dienoyl-CoA reductase-like NADH-dependent reductase (Old Yellow Enzyme family)/pyruvate/2-oxoglutarate dehydrogenase complex dihydrolipoamide dehydrogenase (E3) component